MERAPHLHTVSLMKKTPLAEKTLQQTEGEVLTALLAGDVPGRGKIRSRETGWQGGGVSPELGFGGLRRGDPLPPEYLMLRLLPRSFRAPQDAVL